MKTKHTTTLAVLTASLLSLSIAGQAAAEEKESKPKKEPAGTSGGVADPVVNDIKIGNRSQFSHEQKQKSTPKKKQSIATKTTHQIDLQSKLASTHLHDGLNVVHSGDGMKLMAEARNNKIVGWSATDDKGNKLPTTVEKDGAGKVKAIRVSGRPQTLVFKIGRLYLR